MSDSTEVFMTKARKCRRCGRILTSRKSVELGYGCRCMELADGEPEEEEPIEGQMNILDFLPVKSDE